MKALIVILSSTWKFAATFPIAIYLFGMSSFETVLYTNIGGLTGIIVFALISKGLIAVFDMVWPEKWHFKRKQKKTFSKQNKRLVLLKNKYGLTGIVILTPVLLSIPVGVFLNTKYYGKQKISYLYLFLSQLGWSIIYTLFYTKLKVVL
jgi:hypothetical protein